MATNKDYIDWVCGQVVGAGEIFCRKMFGEYMVYCDVKPVLLVCDNTVFVKRLPETEAVFARHGRLPEEGVPYNGAKPHYILDMEDIELAIEMVRVLAAVIPLPKPRAKKKAAK
ncbi:MAG: hypothetical protein LBL52_00605 [Rickettsiales bacterium]|jgi:hypothetical protein|nr:hypothetical protein [Rickettsiales bacterium]